MVKFNDCLILSDQLAAILVLPADRFDKLHIFEFGSEVSLVEKAFLVLVSVLSNLVHEPAAFPDFSLAVSFAIVEHVVDDLIQRHYLLFVALFFTVGEQAAVGCVVFQCVFFVLFFVREQRMRFLDLASNVLANDLPLYSGLNCIFDGICLVFLVTVYFHLLHLLCFLHFLHVVIKYCVSLSEDIVLLFLLLHLLLFCLHNLSQVTDLLGQIINLSSLFFDDGLLISHFF